MKKLTILIFIMLLSCQNKTTEYYDNGNVKREYNKTEGKLDGVFKEFYDDKKIKTIHNYRLGVLKDTSYFYDKNESLNSKIIWSNNFPHGVKRIYQNTKLVAYGDIIYPNKRINKWNFISQNNFDSIVQYKIINDTSYVNQFWVVKNQKDTLSDKSNYYKIFVKDTVKFGKIVRVRVSLESPHLNKSSDIEVILPYQDKKLLDDYSNINRIKKDTFLSLKNDNINHSNIPEYINQNHTVEFGLAYSSYGSKRIRGIIVEYSKGIINREKDTIDRIERRLYFEKNVYIEK